ncbi:MAG TPA: UDP-N-acetylglucosamine 1-carboxyvinyltransferase, partial [Planctomycetes bacterium]|nr:UDP-N-acetylglucosamine 1-carboxyvinyltransferase [Planctomycetota bacterium]
MKTIFVKGPVRLNGTVRVGGSKNAVLPIMAASILAQGRHYVENVPFLTDVVNMACILHDIGVDVFWVDSAPLEVADETRLGPRLLRKTRRCPAWNGYPEWRGTSEGMLEINVGDITSDTAGYDAVTRMRASISILGPLVAKTGHARVSMPGGCVIGPRPIDLHVKGLRSLGAAVEMKGGFVEASADGLHGNRVYLGGPRGSTVLGTATVLSAACLADGVTVIEHAAQEPEIADLVSFLRRAGAKISGEGTHRIVVEGVSSLHSAHYRVIPDRIEAGTIACAAAATGGEIVIENARFDHLFALWDRLEALGAFIDEAGGAIMVRGPKRPRPADVCTFPYPGFPTDLQAQIAAALARADGTSVVTDRVFPERFWYAPELARLGANIKVDIPSVAIEGVDKLWGAEIAARDLRGAAALLIAALTAEGETVIRDRNHLDRGYDDLCARLVLLGADVHVDEAASDGEET